MDPEISAYYQRAPEETRLATGPFRLEEARTRELILRHAPTAPAVVLDIGGAAGAYAFWLAGLGYEVRLIDASARLVDVARTRNDSAARRLASIGVGDARSLSEPDACAQMVLLLGPLYHLVEAMDRRRALAEAARVLRPGGVLIAAGISRWASILDGLSREALGDPAFARIVERDLVDGQHRNPTDEIAYFTTAYFHRPDELREEVRDAGLVVEGLFGVEGPGWMFPDFMDRWQDGRRREMLIEAARKLESEPSVIGTSAHLIVVGRKETDRATRE